MAIINSQQFSYNTEDQTFVAEASSIGIRFSEPSIGIRSARTGTVAYFIHDCPIYDEEGDLEAWIMKPSLKSRLAIPDIKNVRVHILND